MKYTGGVVGMALRAVGRSLAVLHAVDPGRCVPL
jgi:hypothetical protein